MRAKRGPGEPLSDYLPISHASVTSARKYDRVRIVIFLAKPEVNEHVARLKRRTRGEDALSVDCRQIL